MKVLLLLGALAVGDAWGTAGSWTWNEAGAFLAGSEDPLFGVPGTFPPTLWNLEGPEGSLVQYDGERGLLRFLLPSRRAFLELPAPRSVPTACALAGGELLALVDNRIRVIFPPERADAVFAPLSVPVLKLGASPGGQPLVQVLTGRWLVWTGEQWQASAPPEKSGSSRTPGENALPAGLPEAASWPERRLLAQTRYRRAQQDIQTAWVSGGDLPVLQGELQEAEAEGLAAGAALRGQGKLEVRWTGTGLEALFEPDALETGPWDWSLTVHSRRGLSPLSDRQTAGSLSWSFPENSAPEDFLWADVEVSFPGSPDRKTFFRLVSPEGLSLWLKSG